MHNKNSLLLACLATLVVPTISSAVPAPPPSAQMNIPNNIRVNPTIMGKISKPASVGCNQLIVRLTEYPPMNFPQAAGIAQISNGNASSCTYKLQVPQEFLGKKVHLWGNLKNPSPLVTVQPVGWNNPLPLPPQLGVVENFNFVVKETVIQ